MKKVIKSKDISVVVQGAINKEETPKCLESIRKYLPDAEIILSTWEGSDVSELDYDKLVLSQDPGTVLQHRNKKKTYYNNINRQLLSTQNGLKKVTRKYAMKLRSDLILSSDKFLEYFDKFPSRTSNYLLFQHKLLTSALFTRYKFKQGKDYIKMPFHISDWWFFGLTEDLQTYLLNTPLVEEPRFTKYFTYEENKNKKLPFNATYKFAPEQYLTYTPFSQHFKDIYMEDAADVSDELFEKYRLCLINNFIILENKQSGIYLSKYYYSRDERMYGENYFYLYNFPRYETEYKMLCDKNYKLTQKNFGYSDEKQIYLFAKVMKDYFGIFYSNKSFIKKMEHLFIGLPCHFTRYLCFLITKH